MFLTRWLKPGSRTHARHGANSRPRFRPAVEGLEAREVPAVLTVTTTADVLDPNDGVLSLREAVLQANATNGADQIVLPAGTYSLSQGSLLVEGPLTLNGSGAASTVIDGSLNGSGRILSASNGSTTLSGLTIRNGLGGGISNVGAKLTVTDCLFSGNSADSGGAIYSTYDGDLTIRNSRFLSNTAVGAGGAVVAYGGSSVSGCTFTGNRAEVGGALYQVQAVSGSTFSDNSANVGGAMVVGVYGAVQSCVFTGNSARDYGGAVIGSGTTEVKGCSFVANSADIGGAVYEPGSVTASTFTRNAARYYGGALAGPRAVTDCVIDSNSAYLGGGGIFNTRVGLTVRNSILSNNAAGYGAALYNGPFSYVGWTGTASLQGCRVTGNTSDYGGAIYIGEQGKVTIQDTTLTANTSQYGAGAVVNAGELVVSGSLITGNSSTLGIGGGILNVGTLTLRDSAVVGNTAPLGGDLFNLGTVFLFDSTVGDRYDG